jgi:hypothetical protein
MQVTAEVDLDDVMYQLGDDELIEELHDRGYTVSGKHELLDPELLDRYDWQKIDDILLNMPYHWEIEALRKKVLNAGGKR